MVLPKIPAFFLQLHWWVCAKYGPEMVVAQSLEKILGKGISVVNLNWYQWRYFPQHKLIMLENSPPIKLLKGSCMLAKHVLFSYLVYACILQNTCNLITWYAHTSYTPYYNLWFTFLFSFSFFICSVLVGKLAH